MQAGIGLLQVHGSADTELTCSFRRSLGLVHGVRRFAGLAEAAHYRASQQLLERARDVRDEAACMSSAHKVPHEVNVLHVESGLQCRTPLVRARCAIHAVHGKSVLAACIPL